MLKEEMHATIQGDVQGVGFRATTKHFAETHKLTGYVRNLEDGAVEICAQGPKLSLEKFLEDLVHAFGPRHIVSIEKQFFPIQAPLSDFTIQR